MTTETPSIDARYQELKALLVSMGRVLVAFSGGTDSALLLKAAVDALGAGVVAVTARSATLPAAEVQKAARLARRLGAAHRIIDSRELEEPAFTANPPDKCYICKKIRFSALLEMAAEQGIPWVVDGENRDDDGDHRPGRRAARELGVRSPLRECGLTKNDIRQISRDLGLPTWNKPADACLASRIPYGRPITTARLRQIDEGEAFIRDLGIARQVRLRHEGATARIEVEPDAMPRFLEVDIRRRICRRLRELGFRFVALDLEGYRTGSLNRELETDGPQRPGFQGERGRGEQTKGESNG